ncbi:MAG: TRAP transporter small permease [Spirochaetales bacterium]|jgi:TRAP-type C4-dicarboxylate transport system permease small subunit|nr:TRAP transporter small permease [Spirochaetales bacterium]
MFQKGYRIYCRIEEIIVGACLTTIVGLTFLNAVLRFLDHPIITSDDISLLLFSWAALLGADVALRYSRLVGMDILMSKLPAKWQKLFQIIVYIIIIGALLLFMWSGFAMANKNWKRAFNSLPISYGWVTLSFPVSCCLMILTAILKGAKVARRFKDDSYNVRKDNPDIVGEEFTGLDPDGSAGEIAGRTETP